MALARGAEGPGCVFAHLHEAKRTFPTGLSFVPIEIDQGSDGTGPGFRFCQELGEGRGASVLHVTRTEISLVREREKGDHEELMARKAGG